MSTAEPLNVSSILARAADLVAAGWTQGALARDASGNCLAGGTIRLDGSVGEPVAFCALGAIYRAAPDPYGPEVRDPQAVIRVRDEAISQLRCTARWVGSVGQWNDAPERTQDEVVAVLRLAAETA